MKTLNRKVILSMMLAVLLAPAAVSAGVYFMESIDKDAEAGDIVRPCVLDYPKRSCPDGKKGQNPCPTDGSYFQTCGCDTDVYKFDASNCKDNKTLGANTCNNKSDTCSCDVKYQYTTANCTGGKALSGNTCDGKYETCGCAAEYSKTCSTNNLIPADANDSCDGKYKACKCPTSYVTCDNGGEIGAAQCTEENGTVKYASCKVACQKNTATCAAEIGGVPTDWTIKNATSSDCECSTTKKYVIMQDMKPEFVAYESTKNKLRRIKATRNFGNVKYGDLGGYLESEDNLSHDGNAWLGCDEYGCALAMSCARIYGNAQVYGGPNGLYMYPNSNYDGYGYVTVISGVQETATNCRLTEIYDNAKVYGGSRIYSGKIYGNATFHGYKRHPNDDRASTTTSYPAQMSIAGEVYEDAQIFAGGYVGGAGSAGAGNNPKVYGRATLGCAKNSYGTDESLCGHVYYLGQVYGDAKIIGRGEVSDSGKVYGNAIIRGNGHVNGNAEVFGSAIVQSGYVQGNAKVSGNVLIAPDSSASTGVPYICGTAVLSGSATVTTKTQSNKNAICKNSYSSGEVAWQENYCSSANCPK